MIDKQSSSRDGTTQIVVYTQTSTPITNPFGTSTFQVRIVSNSACHYQIGDGVQTAVTTTSPYLPANWIEYKTVTPGQRISAIRSPTAGLVTATDGTLYVTEVS